jgi:hypothetical protein
MPQQQYPQQRQYSQPNVQTMSPPLTPHAQSPQQPSNYAPSPYTQPPQGFAQQGNGVLSSQSAPQQRGGPIHYPQQANNSFQPQHQFHQPQPQYQQPQQQQFQQQTKRSSMIGSSLMGGSMMSKMSTKLTSFQKPSAGGPPTDWKKWAKRATIGAAGIGALALGVDAAGDMFSGAEGLADFGGGGEVSGFEGGGFEGGVGGEVMVDQTAVDASNAQLMMEGIGQDNASMLLDPVGTTCKFSFPLFW